MSATNSETDRPRCPLCGRIEAVISAAGRGRWYCRHCGMEFDDEDDGDIGYGPPDRRLRRQERRASARSDG